MENIHGKPWDYSDLDRMWNATKDRPVPVLDPNWRAGLAAAHAAQLPPTCESSVACMDGAWPLARGRPASGMSRQLSSARRRNPIEEAEGDSSKIRHLKWSDVEQCVPPPTRGRRRAAPPRASGHSNSAM